jgi:hypothetical protein
MFFKKKKEPKYVVVDCAFNCIKDRCPKWVILNRNIIINETGEKKVIPEGKCAIAWIPELMIELLGKK